MNIRDDLRNRVLTGFGLLMVASDWLKESKQLYIIQNYLGQVTHVLSCPSTLYPLPSSKVLTRLSYKDQVPV